MNGGGYLTAQFKAAKLANAGEYPTINNMFAQTERPSNSTDVIFPGIEENKWKCLD